MSIKVASIKGVTLIELMIVVVIVGILSAIAIPSFITAIRASRLTASANQFIASLSFARSEAVKRGQIVVARINGANWENGWEVFVDIDRSTAARTNVFNDDNDNNLCEAAEDCKLRIYEPLPNNFTLRSNNFPNYISYFPSGESNTNGSFAICDNTDGNNIPESRTAKHIVVNSTGRLRQNPDNNNDGIPDGLTSCNNP
ncbi:Type IV fimbrial biogenesis protein FimT [Methylomonas albis]|uniref:Type II secretion system protein H n=1 Tax=Methylomonas albis TaxID=1854563 RepID=A0ABR9D0D7_9GAMM|nr:GspH/FimT family pseudopilin [Methylomonas albis]MBD9355674.1 GspH/FimT family pseudopilin [Methylomonas albis]CAD6878688.1 Type IV fimbrial biogenesis protein FimT [Methylomonas albis]